MIRVEILVVLLLLLSVPAEGQPLDTVRQRIGARDSVIIRAYGAPDIRTHHEGNEAHVWTYVTVSDSAAPTRDSRGPVVEDVAAFALADVPDSLWLRGYRQFAFWNGRVAAMSIVKRGREARTLYRTGHRYLQEEAEWVGQGPKERPMRMTRIGDDVWTIARSDRPSHTQAVLRVGDAGYVMCSESQKAELQRVKSEFGVERQ